jgi:hypothetical protein
LLYKLRFKLKLIVIKLIVIKLIVIKLIVIKLIVIKLIVIKLIVKRTKFSNIIIKIAKAMLVVKVELEFEQELE